MQSSTELLHVPSHDLRVASLEKTLAQLTQLSTHVRRVVSLHTSTIKRAAARVLTLLPFSRLLVVRGAPSVDAAVVHVVEAVAIDGPASGSVASVLEGAWPSTVDGPARNEFVAPV